MSYNICFIHKDLLERLPALRDSIDINATIGVYRLNDMVFTAKGEPRPTIDRKWYDEKGACSGIRVFTPQDPSGVPLVRDPNYVMFRLSNGN